MSFDLMGGWPNMTSTGEAVLFWVVAVVMVLGALGVLFFRKAAYAVLSMVLVMLGVAVLFFMLQAPFNGAVQIIVYTGAIMMMFLFVIMMIGLGETDNYRRQRATYIAIGCGLALLLAIGLVAAVAQSGTASGTSAVFGYDQYSDEPIDSLAVELFQNHWVTIELAAALLVTAALGALLLTHSDRMGPKLNQHEVALARIRGFGKGTASVSQRPAPGVYARSNAVDNPAISGETLEPIEESIPRVLRLSGAERPMAMVEPQAAVALQAVRRFGREQSRWGTAPAVGQSGALGMPGEGAPTGLTQVTQADVQEAAAQEAASAPAPAEPAAETKEVSE